MAVEIAKLLGYAGSMAVDSSEPEPKGVSKGSLVGRDVLHQPASSHAVPEEEWREINELNSVQVEAESGLKGSNVKPLEMNERDRDMAKADTGREPPYATPKPTAPNEGEKLGRRELFKKGGLLALGGIAAAAAGFFGTHKAGEKGIGQTKGIEDARNSEVESKAKMQREVHGNESGPRQPEIRVKDSNMTKQDSSERLKAEVPTNPIVSQPTTNIGSK